MSLEFQKERKECIIVCVCVRARAHTHTHTYIFEKWLKIYQIWQETISYSFKKVSKHEIGTQMNLNQNTLQSNR